MVRSSGTDPAGILYVIAMPIGNPGDITLRALEVLREVDLIACEDTRRTGAILAAYQIGKPLISHFEHNEERRVPELVERMTAGERIALVTDAGTPAISDPGYRLVRAAHEAGIRVRAIPGPSAAIAALSISGLASNRFTFEGFLPSRDAARRNALDALGAEPRTMIFYEAARRLADTLTEMAHAFGDDRAAVVVREITKTYEETVRGSLGELAERYRREEALGEIVIVIEGAPEPSTAPTSLNLSVDDLIEAGLSLKQATALIAKLTGASRRDLYQEALKRRRENE
ncbi:MAG TPA: 16S rRNA (cytidine(1402)-2'-O)-methyltransferase [Candidatus Binataceae bacterium]|nr:16S rRNA (cytidine(1402)-2'-O)-methyltransferase [Candidatus Binataceae bacterium]